MLVGLQDNEDAAIVAFPHGQALVQTLDFFTPLVDDPYQFGQIAAANALSDVYAMGGLPLCAMNIVCFPVQTMKKDILRSILRGGLDKVLEAGAAPVGGHSVEDDEIKYGLSVSGIVDPNNYASNRGLRPGDKLVLTKPIGTGILATAIKADWEGSDRFAHDVFTWSSRLNCCGGEAIRKFKLKAATDITGFGLGGHLLEMARASKVDIELESSEVPLFSGAYDLASIGLVPAGSFANKKFFNCSIDIQAGVDQILVDILFDAQTSGGLVLAVPEELLSSVTDHLSQGGDMSAVVGSVKACETAASLLHIL